MKRFVAVVVSLALAATGLVACSETVCTDGVCVQVPRRTKAPAPGVTPLPPVGPLPDRVVKPTRGPRTTKTPTKYRRVTLKVRRLAQKPTVALTVTYKVGRRAEVTVRAYVYTNFQHTELDVPLGAEVILFAEPHHFQKGTMTCSIEVNGRTPLSVSRPENIPPFVPIQQAVGASPCEANAFVY